MFDVTQRQIYEYSNHDGSKRFADPMRVFRKVKEYTSNNFSTLVTDSKNNDPKISSPAMEQLAQCSLFAFDVEHQDLFDPTTGQGWTELQLITLIGNFNDYLASLKKVIGT